MTLTNLNFDAAGALNGTDSRQQLEINQANASLTKVTSTQTETETHRNNVSEEVETATVHKKANWFDRRHLTAWRFYLEINNSKFNPQL